MSGAFSKRHYARLANGRPDTAEAVAERLRWRKAGEQANREMMERFAPLTADNAQQAVEWQAARIVALTEGK